MKSVFENAKKNNIIQHPCHKETPNFNLDTEPKVFGASQEIYTA